MAEAEVDEMWNFVGKKQEPRWLWHALDHQTGKVLAYVFGRRKDEVFLQLKALLEPFGITRYYTDYWGAYERNLAPEVHSPGKQVAYLLAADIVSRLPSYRLSDDHQPVIMTRNRFSTPRSSLFSSLYAHPSRSIPRSSTGILF